MTKLPICKTPKEELTVILKFTKQQQKALNIQYNKDISQLEKALDKIITKELSEELKKLKIR